MINNNIFAVRRDENEQGDQNKNTGNIKNEISKRRQQKPTSGMINKEEDEKMEED